MAGIKINLKQVLLTEQDSADFCLDIIKNILNIYIYRYMNDK